MKLLISSDWHLEQFTYSEKWGIGRFIKPDEDYTDTTLILAGDILQAHRVERYRGWFDELSKRFKHVITIMGNHEHYHSNMASTYSVIKQFLSKYDNIHILENETLEIEDVVFFGSTLWTDYQDDPLCKNMALAYMADYKYIRHDNDPNYPYNYCSPLLMSTIIETYKTSLEALQSFFLLTSDKKKIIITHNAPFQESVHEQWKHNKLNGAFVNDLEKTFPDDNNNISLWAHGHTHSSFDYEKNSIRVVCNPHGYGNENDKEFNKELMVTI